MMRMPRIKDKVAKRRVALVVCNKIPLSVSYKENITVLTSL